MKMRPILEENQLRAQYASADPARTHIRIIRTVFERMPSPRNAVLSPLCQYATAIQETETTLPELSSKH